MEKKYLRLFGINSGEFCPDTGTWYANLVETESFISFDHIQKFEQGAEFPRLNSQPTKWTYFVETY